MNKLGLITKTTFSKNVRSWGYWGMVLIPLVLLIVGSFISYLSNDNESSSPSMKVAVVDSDLGLVAALAESDRFKVVEDIKDRQEAEKALENDTIQAIVSGQVSEEGVLEVELTEIGNFSSAQEDFETLMSALQSQLYASHLGLEADQVRNLLSPASISYQTLQVPSDQASHRINPVQLSLAYVVVILSFVILMYYAQTVINEIAADKGTRMMEVILSSTSARNHFLGKLFGIGLLILIHMVVYLVLGVLVLFIIRNQGQVQLVQSFIQDSQGLGKMVVLNLVYFVLALVIYLLLAALVGSMVSKIEDASKAVAPIGALLGIGLYLGIFGMMEFNHPLVHVTSYVPFFTPFVMPFRMATNSVGSWGIVASILFSVLFVFVLSSFAIRLYEVNVLSYSDRSLRENFVRSWRSTHGKTQRKPT